MLYLCTSLFLKNSSLWEVRHSRICKHTNRDGSACVVLNLTKVYLEQVLQPYSATPADCSIRQHYHYLPYHISIIKDGKDKAIVIKKACIIRQQMLDSTQKT